MGGDAKSPVRSFPFQTHESLTNYRYYSEIFIISLGKQLEFLVQSEFELFAFAFATKNSVFLQMLCCSDITIC